MAFSGKVIMTAARKRPRESLKTPSAGIQLDGRDQLITASQEAAMTDNRFLGRVQEADSYRDLGNWQAAEVAYAAALSLHPYERSYWVQHGHMAKEQGNFVRAEISYRTACALGAPPHDVMEHIRHVMLRQSVDENQFPARFYRPGPAARQVPAHPDVALFARLVWRVSGVGDRDMLDLLRANATCDELLAAMCRDQRFERVNRIWLEVVREHEI